MSVLAIQKLRANTRLLLSRITRDEEMDLHEAVATAESAGGDEAVVKEGKALLVVLATERLRVAMEVCEIHGLQAAIARAEHEILINETMLVKEARRLLEMLAADALQQATTHLNRLRLRSALSLFGGVEGADEVELQAKAVAGH